MKRMKRLSAFVLLIATVFLLCACDTPDSEHPDPKSQNVEYIAYEVGPLVDRIDLGRHHAHEYSLWNEGSAYHRDETAPREMTVEFNGKTYVGTYAYSHIRKPNIYVSHVFHCEGSEDFFEINADTGELSYLSLDHPSASACDETETDYKKIADAIADDYIDLSDYQTEAKISSVEDRIGNYYSSKYYRFVDGYQTNDQINIVLDGDGNVVTFEIQMIGSFEGVETSNLDSSLALEAVYAKLDAIYQTNPYEKEYEIEDVRLIRLEDGSFAHYYKTELIYYRVHEGQKYRSDGYFDNILLVPRYESADD